MHELIFFLNLGCYSNAKGLPYWTDENGKGLILMELHMEDLEMAAHSTITILRVKMRVVDQGKELIEQQRKVITAAELWHPPLTHVARESVAPCASPGYPDAR